MILRSILCLGCLWLLLVNVSTITTTISQDTSNELVAGASWSYRLITRSELRTSGEYEGTYFDRSIVEGRNIIKEITAYNIEIEESWSWNSTQKGTGHYESSSGSELITGFSTYTIDRNTLTYTSYKTSNGTYEQDMYSYIGLPVVEFISTSLQSGQNVAYNVLGRRENCSVTYNVINFQGASLPVITLHYSGIGGLDAWLATEGTGESTFNFDKSSGLLVSYSARYSASSKGRTEGTRTNTQEYVVYEISASPPDYTPIIIVAILTIIGIIIFAYVSKRLKTERAPTIDDAHPPPELLLVVTSKT